jgi:hypothetical protein
MGRDRIHTERGEDGLQTVKGRRPVAEVVILTNEHLIICGIVRRKREIDNRHCPKGKWTEPGDWQHTPYEFQPVLYMMKACMVLHRQSSWSYSTFEAGRHQDLRGHGFQLPWITNKAQAPRNEVICSTSQT